MGKTSRSLLHIVISTIPAAALFTLVIIAGYFGPLTHLAPPTLSSQFIQLHSKISSSSEGLNRTSQSAVEFLPSQIDDMVLPFDSQATQMPIHLIRFYRQTPIKPNNSLCWMECLSLLSMLTYIQPSRVYVHTNYPDFWPFDSCDDLITAWSKVKLVYTRRRFVVNGRRLNSTAKFLAHEADVAKLITLYKYGGIAADFDVFFLPNITDLLAVLKQGYECIISKEEIYMRKMNAGFIVCQRGSNYLADILDAYASDYRAGEWVYNSGEIPWKIYTSKKIYDKNIYVDNELINNPGPDSGIWRFIYGPDKVNWRKKPAVHSVYHDCKYSAVNATAKNTSFAELLNFIQEDTLNRTKSHV